MVIGAPVQLVVYQKVFEHYFETVKLVALKPGKQVGAQMHLSPLAQGLRLRNVESAQFGPDGDAGVRCEDVR